MKVISRGNPAASRAVSKIQGGGHFGHFSKEELDIIRTWITDGAPGIRRAAKPAAKPETPAQGGPGTEKTNPTSPAPGPPEKPGQPAAPSTLTWDDDIGPIFKTNCAGCHSGSTHMSNLDLSTFKTAMAGGKDKVFVPGDPDNSLLIQKMKKGGHPGKLSDDDLEKVRQWVLNNCPENKAAPAQPTPVQPPSTGSSESEVKPPAAGAGSAAPSGEGQAAPASVYTWVGGIGDLFKNRCGTCHSTGSHMGGLDLTTYLTAMSGGKDKVITPGDPDNSLLVKKVAKGEHPGHLADEEMDMVRTWILKGALER
jgi:mono/diheme cytochrome c family protein